MGAEDGENLIIEETDAPIEEAAPAPLPVFTDQPRKDDTAYHAAIAAGKTPAEASKALLETRELDRVRETQRGIIAANPWLQEQKHKERAHALLKSGEANSLLDATVKIAVENNLKFNLPGSASGTKPQSAAQAARAKTDRAVPNTPIAGATTVDLTAGPTTGPEADAKKFFGQFADRPSLARWAGDIGADGNPTSEKTMNARMALFAKHAHALGHKWDPDNFREFPLGE